ncbi:CHRD domain-containing protein [Streptomyces sp. 8N706]|uniref:CHRD domain-containing protein n=1 Tax=Streptomyces sp. 8N706 TaxID=3457416 RepID=UPI003FD1414A
MRFLTGIAVTALGCAAALSTGASPAGASPAAEASGSVVTPAAHGPSPEDPNGRGTFWYRVKDRTLCYELTVQEIATPTAAEVRAGKASANGPVVVQLKTPKKGEAHGCLTAQPQQTASDAATVLTVEELAAFLEDPSDFHVNISNRPYPDGAIRWQL